jgi:hypothetical protein
MMPSWLDDGREAAAADGDATALMAVGTCWTEPGCVPGAVEIVTGAVLVVAVSARAWPDEKTTRPNRATAPTKAAGAAIRVVTALRRIRLII